MTGFIIDSLTRLNRNRHTSAAGIVYVIAKFACPILSVWFPNHKPQLEATSNYLEGAAVFYGFASAGDADKTKKKDSK